VCVVVAFSTADGTSIDLSTSTNSNTREARLGDVGLIVLDEVRWLCKQGLCCSYALSLCSNNSHSVNKYRMWK